MFNFSYDAGKALLSIVEQGYWSLDEFNDYQQQFRTHHHEILATRKSYRILSDCRDYPVQSTEVGQAMIGMYGMLMAENPGRYAIVVNSTLNKMQARRILPQRNVEIFTSDEWDPAMEWLFAEGSLPE